MVYSVNEAIINMDLMAVIYGLLSAACWGAGDFSGGLASRRGSVFSVVIASQVIGLVILALLALALDKEMLTPDHILWGGLAGMFGGAGLLALYRGLSQGNMSVVAPVAAVVTVVVAVIVGIVIEGLPGIQALIGFAFALGAVWFVSQTNHGKTQWGDLKMPVAAGLGFGLFMVFLDHAGATSVLWPLVAVRVASISLLFSIATITRQPYIPGKSQLPLIAVAGILDSGGNAFFALAAQAGRLDIAAVVASLYPAMTVLLAWVVLRERISRQQWLGVVFALLAIVLIAAA